MEPRRVRTPSPFSGLLVLIGAALALPAQPSPRPPIPGWPSPEERQQIEVRTREDHAHLQAQLGITRLRPGRDGSGRPDAPNAANYNEATANPYPDWPDVLRLNNGRRISHPNEWWEPRRPEIVDAFEREVVGRLPATAPKIEWQVVDTITTEVGGRPVRARLVVGHADNSAAPEIKVAIRVALVTPVEAAGPVPVLMMFGFGNMPDEPPPRLPFTMPEPSEPPSPDQLIAAGWGYAAINPWSIQPDHGAGLTEGVIGLSNRGQRRKPEDWGALRAWAWGASRFLDFLEADPTVDAKRIGIEGVSRFGKAALVAMAFDPRFAVALIGSSGEGGASPYRRNFGESVENLASSGAYHWMAGNFLKYAAEEATFGSKDANDLPIDAHHLIALCAPRPTFISYGIPEKGDALWLDQPGSFMATVAAGEVYRLLGASDLGVREDYRAARMPAFNTDLVDGALAWRQHDGGHESRSNMRHFIRWADRQLGSVTKRPPPRSNASLK
jgi:hypothetical protein